MCVRWDGGTLACIAAAKDASGAAGGQTANSLSAKKVSTEKHAGDGEQIPAAGRDWLKNLLCLCTFVPALEADWLIWLKLALFDQCWAGC